jgi:hypothetical protein
MPFIGNKPSNNFVSLKRQDITGDGTASYTLDYKVASVNDILVYVNHVKQDPSSMTVSGTSLTMGGNVSSSDDFYVIFLGQALQTVTPADNTITGAMLQDDAITSGKLPAGTILQVVQTVKSDTFATTSTTFTDLTGLSVAITPSSSSNKVLIHVSINFGGSENLYFHAKLLRGSTDIGIGDAGESSQTRATIPLISDGNNLSDEKTYNSATSFLDSPSTTSATTYKIQVASYSGDTRELKINRPSSNSNSGYIGRYISTITAMEVSA